MATKKTESLKRLIRATLACTLTVSLCAAAGTPHERAALTDLAGDVRTVVFSPDGKTLAVCTGVNVRIWDSLAKAEKFILSGGAGATFSPLGDLVAYPGQDETNNDGLMIWDISGKDLKPEEASKGKKRIFIPDDNVRSPQFSPDGKAIAAAVGGKVKFWDVATGKEGEPLVKGHKSSISVIAFVNNGKNLISADARGLMVLWDIGDPAVPKKVTELTAQDGQSINAISVTRAGNVAVLCTGGGEILIVDAVTLKPITSFRGTTLPKVGVKSVSVSPDGNYIASACSGTSDFEIKLWEAGTRKQVAGFIGHQNGVNCVAFSPDGATLATGSDDRTVKVWDVAALLALKAPIPKPVADKPAP